MIKLCIITYWNIILELDVDFVKEFDLVIWSQNPWPRNFADSLGASAFRIFILKINFFFLKKENCLL